jgi:hypothetical protein
VLATQTQELLNYLANRDNRWFDDASAAIWHATLIDLDIREVRVALSSADNDRSIEVVTADDILRHHAIVTGRVDRVNLIEQVQDALEHTPRAYQYEGLGLKPWKDTPAPKPLNFDAMVAAYQASDSNAVNREVSLYKAQVKDAGIDSDFPAAQVTNRATRRAAK